MSSCKLLNTMPFNNASLSLNKSCYFYFHFCYSSLGSCVCSSPGEYLFIFLAGRDQTFPVLVLPGRDNNHSLFHTTTKPVCTLIFVLYMKDFTIIICVCWCLYFFTPQVVGLFSVSLKSSKCLAHSGVQGWTLND